ncbi:hypothetical protein F5888DRAFT_1853328 [Russula emetica]|nr:hypothetical protein F5888DRAFT_1853328 [Russula emetica]
MSAYGAVTVTNKPVDLLPPTTWDLPQPVPGKPTAPAPFRRLVLHHLRLESARALPAAGPSLLEYTHRIFAAEVEAGRTYPQEAAYTRAAFEAYFWAADVIVAIGQTDDDAADGDDGGSDGGGQLLEISLGGRSWEDALVGFYYVKPNYPGRSSHICNAGFIISPVHREFGYGKTLGKSYLHYGPALGYKASVFNLVYANNIGSLRIWDSLGFTRAGLIPRAGRLRRADGNGEEWVDSVIYYRSFVEEEEWTRPIEQ